MDPGDAALFRCRRRRPLTPLFLSDADVDAAVGRYNCRLRPLLPPVAAAASVHFRLYQPPPPMLSATPAVTAGR